MAHSRKQYTPRRDLSEEERRRVDIGLRGGKDVERAEEDLATVEDENIDGGRAGGALARDRSTEDELKSDAAKKEGRKGGRPERG